MSHSIHRIGTCIPSPGLMQDEQVLAIWSMSVQSESTWFVICVHETAQRFGNQKHSLTRTTGIFRIRGGQIPWPANDGYGGARRGANSPNLAIHFAVGVRIQGTPWSWPVTCADRVPVPSHEIPPTWETGLNRHLASGIASVVMPFETQPQSKFRCHFR